MKEENIKKTPLLVRLVGIPSVIYQSVSEITQSTLRGMSLKLAFTAIVSGALGALALSLITFKSMWAFFPILIGWAGFIYLFDKMVLFSRKNPMITGMVRLMAIFVFSFLHTMLLDTLIFKPDIERRLQEEYLNTLAYTQDTYNQDIVNYESQIQRLNNQNKIQYEALISHQTMLFNEAAGSGPSNIRGIGKVYQAGQLAAQEKERLAQSVIDQNNTLIKGYEKKIEGLKQASSNHSSNIPTIGDAGLMVYIETLHEMVFEGNGTLVLLSFVWLMFFGFIESLPLLARLNDKLDEYDELSQEYITRHKQVSVKKFETNMVLEQHRLAMREQIGRLNNECQNEKAILDIRGQQILNHYTQEIKDIQTVERFHDEYDNELNSQESKTALIEATRRTIELLHGQAMQQLPTS